MQVQCGLDLLLFLSRRFYIRLNLNMLSLNLKNTYMTIIEKYTKSQTAHFSEYKACGKRSVKSHSSTTRQVIRCKHFMIIKPPPVIPVE